MTSFERLPTSAPRRPLASLALFLVMLPPAWGESASPLDVGDRRQVFIDNRFLEFSRGVRLHVHPPRKTGELSIAQEHPWESRRVGLYGTVLKVGETYHMWYESLANFDRDDAGNHTLKVERDRSGWQRFMCYARSRDGITWEKPNLGLVEFEGSRKNNIVAGHGAAGIEKQAYGMVFLDPNAPPAERFRLVVRLRGGGRNQLNLYSAPDGIHFRPTYERVLSYRDDRRHHLDTYNIIFWDDRIRKYVAYVRRNAPGPGQHRTNARSESLRLDRFPDIEDSALSLSPDRLDLHHFDPVSRTRVPVADFYTSIVVKYPWAQDAYYAFPSLYYHYDGRFLHEFREETPHNTGANDIRFAASRDGIAWNRYDRRPFVELGMDGEFDTRDSYMVHGVVPALNGREMYLYYSGKDMLHAWGWGDRRNRLIREAGLAPDREMAAISRLVLRRDGFISVRADYLGGEFTTPLLSFRGSELVLNVNTSAGGIARVAVLDSDFRPLDGYSLEDCDRIHTTNRIERRVSWNGKSDLSSLAGRPVRLHFELRDLDLYGFRFRNR